MNTKKLLVLTLVAVFVLGTVSAAFAATTVRTGAFSDLADDEAGEALSFLGAFGIYKGDAGLGGAARPGDPITRAEFAAVVVRMLGKEKIANALATYTPAFKDANEIPLWAWGVVNVASNMGIVNGFEDGTFRANDNVTHAQVLAMLIRALGHDTLVTGTWPINYVMYGADLGLTDDVEIFANLPATRGEVALMTKAAMGAQRYSVATEEFGDSILDEDYATVTGMLTDFDLEADDPFVKVAGEVYYTADDLVIVGADSLDAFKGTQVDLWMIDDNKVVFLKAADVEVVTGKFAETTTDEDGKKYIVLEDETKVECTDAPIVVLNEATSDLDSLEPGDEVTINLEGDLAVYVVAFREDITNAVVDAATDYDAEAETDATITIDGVVYDVPQSATVTINGDAATPDDLDVNDIVYIATEGANSTKAIAVRAIRQVVEGTVADVKTFWTSSTESYKVVVFEDGSEVRLDGPTAPAKDSIVKYALNELGYARHLIGETTTTNNVLVTGFYTSGGVNYAIVDKMGTSVTYAVYGTAVEAGDIGSLGTLTISDLTGKITAFQPIGVGTTVYEVYAVDAANGSLTIGDGIKYYFVKKDDLVVYAQTSEGDIGDYIGLAGLSVGDLVYTDDAADAKAIVKKYEE